MLCFMFMNFSQAQICEGCSRILRFFSLMEKSWELELRYYISLLYLNIKRSDD